MKAAIVKKFRGFVKHAYLLTAFFRASAIADLEYRANIAVKIFSDILWYVAQLSIFEVLFRHASAISGWTLDSTRVFMGLLFMVDALWMLIFSANLERLSDKVRRGELDLLLTKPVSSQFMLSTQKMSVAYIGNFFLASCWLAYAFSRLPAPPSLWNLCSLLVTIPCGLMVIYGMRFFFSASALIFERAENINYVWYQIYRLGTRPDSIYPPWLRYVVLSAVPVAFIASVPARSILEGPSLALIGSAIGLAAMFLWLSTRFWAYGLSKYSSSSS